MAHARCCSVECKFCPADFKFCSLYWLVNWLSVSTVARAEFCGQHSKCCSTPANTARCASWSLKIWLHTIDLSLSFSNSNYYSWFITDQCLTSQFIAQAEQIKFLEWRFSCIMWTILICNKSYSEILSDQGFSFIVHPIKGKLWHGTIVKPHLNYIGCHSPVLQYCMRQLKLHPVDSIKCIFVFLPK